MVPDETFIDVIIIGAGVVGLETATYCIEKMGLRNVKISIMAEKFIEQTTTYGSGGLWEPYEIEGTPKEKIIQWGSSTFDHFRNKFRSTDSNSLGIQLITSYILSENTMDQPIWKDIVFNYKDLPTDEIIKMQLPTKYKHVSSFSTFVVDQKYYLQHLTKNLLNHGVTFVQRKMSTFSDCVDLLPRSESLNRKQCIINCAGLGAYTLVNDMTMYPIRGQVLRVKAPWIKSVWFFGSSYIIPNCDTVVLGGTNQKGNWDTNVSLEDSTKILDDIAELFPSIRDCFIESAWVGLRPGRTPLRLDFEDININSTETSSSQSSIRVIHCYGHGGSGVTLARGCAEDVVNNYLLPYLNS